MSNAKLTKNELIAIIRRHAEDIPRQLYNLGLNNDDEILNNIETLALRILQRVKELKNTDDNPQVPTMKELVNEN